MTRLTQLLSLLALTALVLGAPACGRSDLLSYDGVSSTDGGADGDSGPKVGCTSSEDCPTAAKPFCELPEGVCVACLTDPDTCPVGEACNPTTHQCQGLPPGGCTSNSQCPATKPVCELPQGVCVGCTNASQCPPGDACQNNQCVASCGGGAACAEGLACCSATCVDEGTNANDCGACGRVCPNGEACLAGACQPPQGCSTAGCFGSDSCCGDTCVNTQVSPQHCGSCATACGADDACIGGTCVGGQTCNGGPVCTGNDQCCSTGCADVVHDAKNCGHCGDVCATGFVCFEAVCMPKEPLCTDGSTCTASQECCPSGCADVSTDPNNCGSCNSICPPGIACQAGQCITTMTSCNGGPACLGVESCCDSGCTDTNTDPNNCGGCDFPCPPGATCAGGNCQPPTSCNGGPVCTGVDQCCASGCTDVDTDVDNCGGCGQTCAPGAVCTGGQCATPPSCNGGPICTGSESCCASGCTDTKTDVLNCGSCGNLCATGDTCVGGTCVAPTMCNGGPACTGGTTCCAVGCIETTSDPANCGGCGKACTSGDTCVGGACVSNEGVFNPTVNPTFLSPGPHSYTSINIPAGITVYVAGAGADSGTLDLSATGTIEVDGTIDVSGGPGTQNTITSQNTEAGRAGAGGYTGEPYQSAPDSSACGFVAGNGGSLGFGVAGSTGSCTVASTTTCVTMDDPNSLLFTSPLATYGGGGGVFTGYRAYGAGGGGPAGGAPGALGAAYQGEADCSGVSGGGGAVNGKGGGTGTYAGKAGASGQTQCPGVQTGVPAAYVGGGGGGGIGAAAAADLPVATTFQTGSSGGGGSADYLNRPEFGGTSGGGGGGGALRLTSGVSITVKGQLLANGGVGGDAVIGTGSNADCNPQPGAAGGGGSGGLVYLSAPAITTAAGATISAAGGDGGAGSEFATGGGGGKGGIGRLRLSVTAPTCATLRGSFTPALPAGCAASPAKAGVAFIGTYPN